MSNKINLGKIGETILNFAILAVIIATIGLFYQYVYKTPSTTLFLLNVALIAVSLLFLVTLRRLVKIKSQFKIELKRFYAVMNCTNDRIVIVDAEMRLVYFNQAYANEFKYNMQKDIKLGMRLSDIIEKYPAVLNDVLKSHARALEGEDFVEKYKYTFDGRPLSYETTSNNVKDEEGKVIYIIRVIRNITQREREQAKLKESYDSLHVALLEAKERNAKTSMLLEMSDVMLACTSLPEVGAAMATYCSKALDYTNGILFIMAPSKDRLEQCACWGDLHTQKINFTVDQCWSLRMGHIHYVDENHTRLICGHVKSDNPDTFNYLCVPLRAQNDIYGLLYIEIKEHNGRKSLTESERMMVTAFAEVAAVSLANMRLRENLRMQSMCDPLTGLYNRRYLGEFLTRQIYQSERTKMPIALLLLDLDHFKKINDVFGHDAGDLALKEFSEVLRTNIRPGDFVSRYGGEEFIVVLYNTSAHDAKHRAESIRKVLPRLKVRYNGEEIGPLTVSVGVAVYPQDGKTTQELIETADKALYKAKEGGRNKVVLATETAVPSATPEHS